MYYNGAHPYHQETNCLAHPAVDARVKRTETGGQFLLNLSLGPEPNQADTKLVTTARLGKARVAGLPYENPDGSALKVDTDYFGKKRSKSHPAPGPFEIQDTGTTSIRVW